MLAFVLGLLATSGCSYFQLGSRGELPTVKLGAYYRLDAPEMFEKGYLREKLVPPQSPWLGEYSCWDVRNAEQHIEWASRYGVDFFALEFSLKALNDPRYELFLQARNIEDIEFCLFLRSQDSAGLAEELSAVSERFFSHPSYLKHEGRPLVVLDVNESYSASDIKVARKRLAEEGYELYLVADGLAWPGSKEFPQGRLPRAPGLDSELFDAVTGYSLFESCPESHGGYGLTRDLIRDLNRITVGFQEQNRNTPVLPPVLVGFNDRGVNPDSPRTVVPRNWRTQGTNSTLAHELTGYALQRVEYEAPFIFVRAWNEWDVDSALEPLKAAEPTRKDVSGEGRLTAGFAYFGNGLEALEEFREVAVPVAGQVVTEMGAGIPGRRVFAWKGRELVSVVKTNSLGEFRFPRSALPAGMYSVGLNLPDSTELRVAPFQANLGFRLETRFIPAVENWELDLNPRLKTLRDGLKHYIDSFPEERFSLKREGSLRYYLPAKKNPGPTLPPELEVSKQGVVLEVGAGAGVESLRLSARSEQVRVYALEEERELYRQLIHNAKLNPDLEVIPLHFALADRPGIKFPRSPVAVEQRTLDSFRFPRLDHLVVRGRAAWNLVLEGASTTAKRHRPEVWLEGEFPAGKCGGVEGWLVSLGYAPVAVPDFGLRGLPLPDQAARAWFDVGRESTTESEGFFHSELEAQTSFAWVEEQGRLELKLEKPLSGSYLVGIRARAFGPLAPLKVQLAVNGGKPLPLTFAEEWSVKELELPASTVRAGLNQIVLTSDTSGRPSELFEGSDDGRRLSLAVDAVWLRPSE